MDTDEVSGLTSRITDVDGNTTIELVHGNQANLGFNIFVSRGALRNMKSNAHLFELSLRTPEYGVLNGSTRF